MSDKQLFVQNMKNLDVKWEKAPSIDEIKKIQARVIIGANGCGKSRLLRALSKTLHESGIRYTDILYADFPEMASLERKGIDEAGLTMLREIFIDRRNTPIYNTLRHVSSDPVKGINSLIALSETDFYCKNAVDKVNGFTKVLFGDSFDLKNSANLLESDKELSPGQRSMFYMSIMLGVLAAHHTNDEFYVLLDEPEQHLHAKAIINFIKQLQEYLPKAKLWIATHSVHLMAHFKFDEIIYVDAGEVQPNNSLMYDIVCETMVDTEEMQQFVSFSGLYGFYEFFRECFSDPGVEGNADDKLAKIKQRVKDCGVKKLLDYGAGKGRFFKLLAEIPHLEYHAFEIDEKYHNDLNLLISPSKLYTRAEDIPTSEFDAVLLINTLHEIPLDQWPDTFATIKRSLTDSGRLFFCETAPLITGEYIKNTGYLVLGAEEQRRLFGVEPIHLDKKQKLHFSEVPKTRFPILNQTKLKGTLNSLKVNSFNNWEREEKNARNAAFYAVQHLNAEKALKQLSGVFSYNAAPDSLELIDFSDAQSSIMGEIDCPKELGGLEWLVIKIAINDYALLLSKYVLERRPYHNIDEPVTWADCDLRKYLNGEFFDRFSEEDRARIVLSKTKTEYNSNNLNYESEEDVEDYIFLPDFQMADQFCSVRKARLSGRNNPSAWRLRTPAKNNKMTQIVDRNGNISTVGIPVSHSTGIRPALWIKL